MNNITDHLPRLRRYARALTGDAFATEDLVQDTVERALSRFSWFRTGSSLDAWLLSIMHNIFISQKRHQALQPPLEPIDEQFTGQIRGTECDGLEIRDLDRALAQLPPEQRAVLLLISLEEFSYEETARIIGVPVGTVMSRLSRGRERLRAILAKPAPHLEARHAATSMKVIK